MRFQDKVCIVTGAASGIGRATSELLASEGARVALIDVDETKGGEVVKALGADRALFCRCNVADPDQVREAVASTLDRWGRLDVIINNAATMVFAPVTELSVEDWDRVLGVNLRSVFLFCRFGIPHMNSGAIVNVSSVHAHETTRNVASYAASKGGIEAFTRALSIELSNTDIRVNCVAPGAVNTPMLWQNPNVKSGAEVISGRVGEPRDLAEAIAFLASDAAAFVRGAVLVCDGGRLDVL